MEDSARGQSAYKLTSTQDATAKLADEEGCGPLSEARFEEGSVSYSHEGKGARLSTS